MNYPLDISTCREIVLQALRADQRSLFITLMIILYLVQFPISVTVYKTKYSNQKNLPLCVVFDSASANSVLDRLQLFSSEEVVLSIFSCLIKGFMSSSGLELVNGEEALLFGVDDAAPSTQRSPGAGSRGEAGGGVWTLLPVVFLPAI